MLYPFVARWTYGWFSARRMPLFGDQASPPAGDPYVAVVSITSDRLVSFGVPFGFLVRLLSLYAGPPNTADKLRAPGARRRAGTRSAPHPCPVGPERGRSSASSACWAGAAAYSHE